MNSNRVSILARKALLVDGTLKTYKRHIKCFHRKFPSNFIRNSLDSSFGIRQSTSRWSKYIYLFVLDKLPIRARLYISANAGRLVGRRVEGRVTVSMGP